MKKYIVIATVLLLVLYAIFKPSEASYITDAPDFDAPSGQVKLFAPDITPLLKVSHLEEGAWQQVATTKAAQELYQHKEPDWDLGAFDSVSPEMGGKGFKGEGWSTSRDFNYIGDPRSKKGGTLTLPWSSYPNCFRAIGRESNTTQIQMFSDMMYETLTGRDPLTREVTPLLATHWKISDDKKTFWFRLNPSARWSDGRSLKASDVIETYELLIDPEIDMPNTNTFYSDVIESVERVSRYIVKFNMKNDSWRNFDIASTISVYPGHVLKKMNGTQFLKKFQFAFMPVSGPYQYSRHSPGESLTIERRKDYWAQDARANIGLNNFDEITFLKMADPSKQFEAVKIGKIDLFQVGRAQLWAQQTDSERFKKGLLQKRKIYNLDPIGISGLCFNMRQAPLNDINVRKAINYAVDFKTLNDKFFFNQYLHMSSYFENSKFKYPKTIAYYYDVNKAIECLNASGWTTRNNEGYFVKNGKELKIRLINYHPAFERIDKFFEECFKKIGMRMVVDKMTWPESIAATGKRDFEMSRMSLTQSINPMPKNLYHSDYAYVNQSGNRFGVSDKRIDKLCEKIEKESSEEVRLTYYHEIDRILNEEIVPMALGWYGPYVRLVFPYYLSYPDQYMGPYSSADVRIAMNFWWFDSDKKSEYDRAKKSGEQLTVGEADVTYWNDWLEKKQMGE